MHQSVIDDIHQLPTLYEDVVNLLRSTFIEIRDKALILLKSVLTAAKSAVWPGKGAFFLPRFVRHNLVCNAVLHSFL